MTLLEHLGQAQAAQRVMQAIEHVTADAALHTRELGVHGHNRAGDARGVCAGRRGGACPLMILTLRARGRFVRRGGR